MDTLSDRENTARALVTAEAMHDDDGFFLVLAEVPSEELFGVILVLATMANR